MILLRRFFDEFTMECARLDVTAALKTIGEWGTEAAKRVHANQSGLRLSDIDSPSIREMAAKLERKIGLPCDMTKSSARMQPPSGTYKLNWHQDYAGMGLKPEQAGMVAWVPLDPIDGTRPGLEVAGAVEPMAHHRDARRFLVADDCSGRPGSVVIDLSFLGDAVLLTPWEPHRTYCTPAMTNSRLSVDMRFQ